MADISIINKDNTNYNVKDAASRAALIVVANAGAKNLAPIETSTNKTGNKWIVGVDSGNTEPINLIAGDYIFTAVSSSTGSGQCQIKLAYSDGTTALTTTFNFGSTMTLTFTASKDVVGYGIYSNPAPVTFEKMMIRPAAITDSTFQPFARTNRELTVLTDEDRAALVELVDNGAKNRAQTSDGGADPGTSWATVSANLTANTQYIISFASLTSDDTDSTTIQIRFYKEGGSDKYIQVDRGSNVSAEFTLSADTNLVRIYKADSNVHGSGDTMSFSGLMIYTKAEGGISHEYQPYRPSWQEMWDAIQALQSSGNRTLTMQMQPTESTEPEEQEER